MWESIPICLRYALECATFVIIVTGFIVCYTCGRIIRRLDNDQKYKI